MASLLKSTTNTRAILPGSLRYVRSDVPCQLTAEEAQWLNDHDLVTVVDLRTQEERERKPCRLAQDKRFSYLCMPVTGGNVVPEDPAFVSQSYIQMVDGQMRNIIHAIETAKSNVLFFCNAGKDRTGVVSAILLHRAGMSRRYILSDYTESADNLKEMLDGFAASNPEIDRTVITPLERYMEEFLLWYEKKTV